MVESPLASVSGMFMPRSKRSFVGPSALMHLFRPVIRHPWIAARLAALQLDKWLFSALHPRASSGQAGRIRQVGVRITDRCNLRCETCGQWGAGGFMHGQDLRARVAAELTTTFASTYTQEVSLAGLLKPEAFNSYLKKATGEKFLVTPQAVP